jgi:hypothetical protein
MMNHSSLRQAVAALLVICVLLVGGLASAQSVTHDAHHAHHEKSTHSTVLCSWMCAAGHVLEGATAPPFIERAPVAFSDKADVQITPQLPLATSTSRGPPVPITI